MNVLRNIFLFIIFLLIKIGDGVSTVIAELNDLRTRRPSKSKKRKKFGILFKRKAIKKSLQIRASEAGSLLKKGVRLGGVGLYKSGIFIRSVIIALMRFGKTIVLKLVSLALSPLRFVRWIFKKRETKVKKKFPVRKGMTFFGGLRLFIFGSLFSFLFIFLPLLLILYVGELPDPHTLSVAYIPKTTKIFDRNNNLLYEIYANQNRTLVSLSDIPKPLQQATISIEDKDFYHHPGFDIRGIARALVSNAKNNDLQGGSTITQQLIRSAFLSPEQSINRKVKEIILAFWSERIYSKNQILELYFNYVPYGGTAWGIEAASEIYFGKKVQDLDLAESSLLAGLPRAPSIYSPFSGNKDLWKKRQKEVLNAMVRDKYITSAQADGAYKEELSFKKPDVPIRAPHFVMYVKDLLAQKYGLSEVEKGGLSVRTTLDLPTQEMTEKIVSDEVGNDGYLGISNGASVVTNPQNGDILAMVGSINYFNYENDGNVNLTTSLRQPGSTIKVVTYTLALSSGFTESTLLDDTPLTIFNAGEAPYTPVNYDGKFRGKIPLRLAFANSLNIPAVRVAQKVGVDGIVKTGQAMGITSWKDPSRYGISITLGGAEVTMLDLATVFGTNANSGKRVVLDPILEVKNSTGQTIYKKEPDVEQVIDPGVSFIVSDILSDNNARSMEFGPNSPLNIAGHRVSVKTGTTDYKRDNWTVGYTKDMLVATWVGNNDNTPMSQNLASGITGAAPIWNKIITNLIKDKVDEPLVVPDNVIKKPCFGRDAYFIRGTENSVSCGALPSISPSATH